MKKLLAITLLLWSTASFAEENYSGIYLGTNATSNAYFSVHHNPLDRSIIIAILDNESENWTALSGSITGGYSDLISILQSGEMSISVDFSINKIKINSCESRSRIRCFRHFEADTIFNLFKML